MKSILIVDDEYFIKQSLTKIIGRLELPFHIIGCVDNGLEALEIIETVQPDLLITDINMPLMDGFELIQEIKNRKLIMDIIILSGYNDFDYVQSALQYRVQDYWLKPIKPEKVQATLLKLQEEWKEKEEDIKQRSKSLPKIMTLAQQLINQVWSLQQEVISQHLNEFHQFAKDAVQEQKNYNLSQIYYDFIVLLDEEIFRVSQNQIDMKAALECKWSGTHIELIDQLNQTIYNLCDFIRQKRNLGYSKLMNEAIQFVSLHYQDDNLSLPIIANHLNISPAHFSRLFKQNTGTTFSHYLIEYRLMKAKELLTQPSVKAIDVCYQVGYQDYPHFTKAFKKKYNVSPTDFKKTIS